MVRLGGDLVLETVWRSAELAGSMQEGVDLAQELGPRRLVGAHEMVAAGERDESCIRYQRRQLACLLERCAQLIPRV